MALTTTTEEVAGRVPITVLALDGELDASNFERLIVEVSGLYDRGTRNLLVDLGGLTFLASSGLVALHSIVRILHGERPDDLESGCRALVERGVGCVAATCGADGVLIVDADGAERVSAFDVDVVDTTGCGDAFSAGFLRGLSLGRDRKDAALLGSAAAALVAQGLGSDYGDFDLNTADEFAAVTKQR